MIKIYETYFKTNLCVPNTLFGIKLRHATAGSKVYT